MGGRRRRRWGSFPTTADVGVWVRADGAAALYEALGLGLFARMTDLRRVRPREERTVSVRAQDPGALAVRFLNELILLQQGEGFLVRDLVVALEGDPPTALVATARGEPFDAARHPRHEEIKAATFHRLAVDPARGRARVIVDI